MDHLCDHFSCSALYAPDGGGGRGEVGGGAGRDARPQQHLCACSAPNTGIGSCAACGQPQAATPRARPRAKTATKPRFCCQKCKNAKREQGNEERDAGNERMGKGSKASRAGLVAGGRGRSLESVGPGLKPDRTLRCRTVGPLFLAGGRSGRSATQRQHRCGTTAPCRHMVPHRTDFMASISRRCWERLLRPHLSPSPTCTYHKHVHILPACCSRVYSRAGVREVYGIRGTGPGCQRRGRGRASWACDSQSRRKGCGDLCAGGGARGF